MPAGNGESLPCTLVQKGDAIVLLHGYLETLEIWEVFAASLAKHYRVITLDLPGHGLSGWNGGVHTMEFMADAVKGVLDKLDVQECLLGEGMWLWHLQKSTVMH